MSKRFTNLTYLAGYILSAQVALTLFISTVSFALGIVMSAWQFPVAFACAGLLAFPIAKQYENSLTLLVTSLLTSGFLIILSILVAGLFYDVSYDGQAYHQETLIQLRNGWNPFYEKVSDSVNQSLYINHYAKAGEFVAASIYLLVGSIESGKAVNLIMLLAAFCLTLSTLSRVVTIGVVKTTIVSAFICLSPICVNQLLTYYVDGLIASSLVCLFCCFALIVVVPNRYNLVLLGLVLLIMGNIKFSSLVYCVLFGGMFLVWLFFFNRRQLFTIVSAFAVAAIFTVLLVGFNPYVINITKYGHPLYPVMGAKKADIFTYNYPRGFEHKGAFDKFFSSLFAHTSNPTLTNGGTVELKIPFTLDRGDIVNAPKVDPRIGGFGPMFSGILLASFILLFIYIGKRGLDRNALFVLYWGGCLILSAMLLPESWWARYIPQLWLLPILILLLYEAQPFKSARLPAIVLYVAILINISFSTTNFAWNFLISKVVDYQMDTLAGSPKPVIVQWGSAAANRIRFQERGIAYSEENLDGKSTENIVRSDSKFLLPEARRPLKEKSIWVVWGEKFVTAEK